MEELSKKDFNYFIVKHRGSVRQAQVQVAHKLIRESKKLKVKKTQNDQQKEKNTRRADRYLDEVKFLKTLHADDVIKFALLNKRSFEDVLNNPKSCVEERALCRIADHKSLKGPILDLRQKYPDWSETLPNLIKSLGALHRKERLKRMHSKGKLEKILERERNLFLLLNEFAGFELDSKLLEKGPSKPRLRKPQKTDKPFDNELKMESKHSLQSNTNTSKENIDTMSDEGLLEDNEESDCLLNEHDNDSNSDEEDSEELDSSFTYKNDDVINDERTTSDNLNSQDVLKEKNTSWRKEKTKSNSNNLESENPSKNDKISSSGVKKLNLNSINAQIITLDNENAHHSDSEDESIGTSKSNVKTSTSFFLGRDSEVASETEEEKTNLSEFSKKRSSDEDDELDVSSSDNNFTRRIKNNETYSSTRKCFNQNLRGDQPNWHQASKRGRWSANEPTFPDKQWRKSIQGQHNRSNNFSERRNSQSQRRKFDENIKGFKKEFQRYQGNSSLDPAQTNSRPDKKKPLPKQTTRELHPSWQAKKQIALQAASIKDFKGKRTTFED